MDEENPRSDPKATLVGGGPAHGGTLRAGDRVGQLVIVNLLGAGGMGEVYIALDERLGRQVALKSVRSERRLSERAKQRFLREARALSSLEHPNICRIYDYIEDDSGDYIVLELLSGRVLSKAASTLGKRERLRVAEEIAGALVAAHASGVIHRDLKPDNVMVTETSEAKVLDFGIARRRGEVDDDHLTDAGPSIEDPRVSLLATKAGTLIGTPVYMSPEQASGGEATSASDMYSFGLLLQEMFTGAPPRDWSQTSEQIIEGARRGERLPVRGVDRGVARLIRHLTAKSPSERPTAEQAVGRLTRLRRRPVRHAIAAISTAIILAGVIGTLKYTLDLESERTRAVEARNDAEDQIEFVLGQLGEGLREMGRLDILEDAAKQFYSYYERRGLDVLSESDLVRYARVLQLIGEVEFNLGDYDAAEQVFNNQIRFLEQVLDASPSDGKAIKALGGGHFYLGYIAMFRGDLERVNEEFQIYLDLGNRLVALDEDNPEWLMEKAYALTNVSAYHTATGDLERARQLQEESIAYKVRAVDLVKADPDASEDLPKYMEDLAGGLAWRMENQDAQGELDAALATAQEVVALRDEVFAARPQHADSRLTLCYALGRQGTLLLEDGRFDDAAAAFDGMLEHARHLNETDPGNPVYMRELGVGHQSRGWLHRKAGEFGRAADSLAAARRILEDLADASPENTEALLDLLKSVNEQIRLKIDQNNPEGAIAIAREFSPRFETLTNVGGIRARFGVVLFGLARARALVAAGQPDAAHEIYEDGLVHFKNIDQNSRTVYQDAMYAELLIRAGNVDEARPIVERLVALGERRRWQRLAELLSEAEKGTAEPNPG